MAMLGNMQRGNLNVTQLIDFAARWVRGAGLWQGSRRSADSPPWALPSCSTESRRLCAGLLKAQL